MKRLQDFIIENIVTEANDAKQKCFVFNLANMENGEETVKSFENMPGVTIDDQKVTVCVSSENFDKLDTIFYLVFREDVRYYFYILHHTS